MFKKAISLLILATILLSIVSCEKEKYKKFGVYEGSWLESNFEGHNYDWNIWDFHKESENNYRELPIVTVFGKDYTLQRDGGWHRKSHYRSDFSFYTYESENDITIQLSIYNDKCQVRKFYVRDEKYLEREKSEKKLSAVELSKIANDYFAKNVDNISNYQLTSELSIDNIYGSLYKFSLQHNDIPNLDYGKIHMTECGEIVYYDGSNLGVMEDFNAPSFFERKKIEKNISQKLDSVYGEYKDSYDIEYVAHQSSNLMRMSNGAFVYNLFYYVSLKSKQNPNDVMYDHIDLYIYLG